MELKAPLVSAEGQEKVAFVDPKSLNEDEAKLVQAIDTGMAAEAELTEKLYREVENSEFSSAEIEINNDNGSYIRVATIDGIEVKDDKEVGRMITGESVNGYLTETTQRLNAELAEKFAEEDAAVEEAGA